MPFVIRVSVTAYVSCPPGSFSATGDNKGGCSPCPLGTYQNGTGSTACIACPSLLPQTIDFGAKSFSKCVAAAQSYQLDSTSATSLPCPAAANCSASGLTLNDLPLNPGCVLFPSSPAPPTIHTHYAHTKSNIFLKRSFVVKLTLYLFFFLFNEKKAIGEPTRTRLNFGLVQRLCFV